MRKKLKAAVVILLAVLLTEASPMQIFAASQKQYLSDLRMPDAKNKLEELGYTVPDKDLNAGTRWYDASKAESISRLPMMQNNQQFLERPLTKNC